MQTSSPAPTLEFISFLNTCVSLDFRSIHLQVFLTFIFDNVGYVFGALWCRPRSTTAPHNYAIFIPQQRVGRYGLKHSIKVRHLSLQK